MNERQNPIKSLVGDTAVYGLGTIVPRLLNYLLTPFFTRILIQSEYGILTEMYSYAAILLVILTYGMETAFFRFSKSHSADKTVYSTAFNSILITTAIFIVALLFFYQDVTVWLKYDASEPYLLYIGLIIAMDALAAIPFAYLRQQHKALRFSLIKLFNVLINIGFNVLFLWYLPMISIKNPDAFLLHFYDDSLGVGYVFLSNVISSGFTLLLLLPEILRVRRRLKIQLLKRMFRYAYPVAIIVLAGMINEVADKLLLKHLLPDTENPMAQLGIYGANFKLAVLMSIFIQMFRFAAEPFFFQHADKKNARILYARVMKYFFIFAWAIFLLVTLFLDVFKYFIDSSYHSGLSIVWIILMAKLFQGVFYNLGVWYKLTDKTWNGAVMALSGTVITIALNLLLVPSLGYVGAAWSQFFCYFAMMVISFLWGRQVYRIPYSLKRMGFYAVFAITLFLIHPYIQLKSFVGNMFISSFLLGLFVLVAFLVERKTILVNEPN
jgi:O-antigen/teichoic acid export membrane protein